MTTLDPSGLSLDGIAACFSVPLLLVNGGVHSCTAAFPADAYNATAHADCGIARLDTGHVVNRVTHYMPVKVRPR